MDIYLPADFRELHDAAPDDWRDASTSRTCERQRAEQRATLVNDPKNACADPLWCVF